MLAQGNLRGLCRLLRHGDPFVRRRAAQALGELGYPDAVSCLARALRKDSDQYVQRWAIDSLQKIGSADAIDVLVEAAFSTRVQIARPAERVLSAIPTQQAAETLRLKDILQRNDWEALAAIDEEAKRPLAVILASEQYADWPAAKRQGILRVAVELGITPPVQYSRELAQMGLYVSGVHTLGDLVRGLRHRNPNVRIAAADRLAATGRSSWWVNWRLYHNFRREARPGGDQKIAAAFARTLDQLGDSRAVELCKETLYAAGGQAATEAAYLLAEIGTPAAVEALFWFAAEPPPPPAYRNVPLAMSALQNVGPAAVDALRPLIEHEAAHVRRLMVDVIGRSEHVARFDLLARLCRDKDDDVQRAALDALAEANTAQAADKLYKLAGDVSRAWLVRALASMTHPAGLEHLRQLAPEATTVAGILCEKDRSPLAGAQVQVVRGAFDQGGGNWGWRAASVRAQTGDDGAFTLAVAGFDAGTPLRLKIVISPSQPVGTPGPFFADLTLDKGRSHHIEAVLDRTFERLILTVAPDDQP